MSNVVPVEDADEEVISISLSLFNQLTEDSYFLALLEAHGVDNWEGYHLACQELDEENFDLED
jgi:hypothetical protein